MKRMRERNRTQGQIAVELLFLSAVVVALVTGFISLAASFVQLSLRAQNKLEAFAAAEAGLEYYRWHLAHSPQDFMDGTGLPGPYSHDYFDKNGDKIGKYSLTIVPPSPGSSIVTMTSVGTVLADASVSKTIQVKLGIASFAKYAWVLNDNVFFGSAAQVYGEVHSNKGVHFDGVAHNVITSALTTYQDPDVGNATEWAVYTDGPPADPTPPTALATSTSNIFLAGRSLGIRRSTLRVLPKIYQRLKRRRLRAARISRQVLFSVTISSSRHQRTRFIK
jgi:hypothetical protein